MNFLKGIFFHIRLITVLWSIWDVPQRDEKRSRYCKRSCRRGAVIWAGGCQACQSAVGGSAAVGAACHTGWLAETRMCSEMADRPGKSTVLLVTFEPPGSGADKVQWCQFALLGTLFPAVLIPKGLHNRVLETTAKPMSFTMLSWLELLSYANAYSDFKCNAWAPALVLQELVLSFSTKSNTKAIISATK